MSAHIVQVEPAKKIWISEMGSFYARRGLEEEIRKLTDDEFGIACIVQLNNLDLIKRLNVKHMIQKLKMNP